MRTWTLAPVTMLGLSWGFPAAFILFCHLLLNANPANIIASDEPTVPTPTAVSVSPSGAWNKCAIMFTHRFCIDKKLMHESLEFDGLGTHKWHNLFCLSCEVSYVCVDFWPQKTKILQNVAGLVEWKHDRRGWSWAKVQETVALGPTKCVKIP